MRNALDTSRDRIYGDEERIEVGLLEELTLLVDDLEVDGKLGEGVEGDEAHVARCHRADGGVVRKEAVDYRVVLPNNLLDVLLDAKSKGSELRRWQQCDCTDGQTEFDR